MFLEFFNLREQPFGVTPDPRFLYLTETHQEALASLFYGIKEGRGFMSLIASPGMGKTTLLFQLMESLRSSASTAFLFDTQCDSHQLLRYVLADMRIPCEGDDRVIMHEKLNRELIKIRQAGSTFVLIIDEAQNLDDTALESIRLLSDFETPTSKLMQIVLSGQPELGRKLATPQMAQLRQRISIQATLKPLNPHQVDRYLDHRLKVAKYMGGPLFDSEAHAAIALYSAGIPRNINSLCFSALSLGFALGKRKIDGKIITEAASDLDLTTRPPGLRPVEFSIAPALEKNAAVSPEPPSAGEFRLRFSHVEALVILCLVVANLATYALGFNAQALSKWLNHGGQPAMQSGTNPELAFSLPRPVAAHRSEIKVSTKQFRISSHSPKRRTRSGHVANGDTTLQHSAVKKDRLFTAEHGWEEMPAGKLRDPALSESALTSNAARKVSRPKSLESFQLGAEPMGFANVPLTLGLSNAGKPAVPSLVGIPASRGWRSFLAVGHDLHSTEPRTWRNLLDIYRGKKWELWSTPGKKPAAPGPSTTIDLQLPGRHLSHVKGARNPANGPQEAPTSPRRQKIPK